MNVHREIVGDLLSWMGQTTPREYVRFLRKSQPEIFSRWPEEDMVTKLEVVVSEAWASLADPTM